MNVLRTGISCAAIPALMTVAALLAQAPARVPDPVIAMVYNQGGFVSPLARYGESGWESLTAPQSPGGTRALTVPGRRMIGLELNFVPNQGQSARRLRLGRATAIETKCWLVDTRSSSAGKKPRDDQNWERIGWAVSDSVTLSPVEDVRSQPDDDSRRLARLLVQQVQAFESELVRRGAFFAAVDAATRARTPVRLRRFDRYRGTYYVEAVKAYRPNNVVLDVFVSGWIRFNPGGIGSTALKYQVTDEDYKSVTQRKPAGIVSVRQVNGMARPDRAGFGESWLMTESGYEAESYSFYEIDGILGRPALTINDDGC